LALLIFDRNLIPMPFPVITRILSISVSQACGSLWPGRKSLRKKKSNKDCQKEYELHRKSQKWPDCIFLHLLMQSFWVPCDLSSKHFSNKNLLFEAEIYVPEYAHNAPFTPELLGALSQPPAVRTTSQARCTSPLHGLDWTT
jgi:hypothetical protein